jgi:hypothetical protein
MAKYKITRSSSTGFWYWECKDGSDSGWASTKSGAKSDASAACSQVYNLNPLNCYDIINRNGEEIMFEVVDLKGIRRKLTSNMISADQFRFFVGEEYDSSLTDLEKVKAILICWGIYKGGKDQSELEDLHYMDSSDFDKLMNKDYLGLLLTIDDETGEYTWSFN